ncbi:MAG: hypothetical protein ABJB01_10360 [Rudaea sp.]
MNPQPLHIFCDDGDSTWSLFLEMRDGTARALRLSVAPLAQTGSRSGTVVGEIREARQIDAVMARVADPNVSPKELSEELIDLLVTLARERPGKECVEFLRWRLCEWIAENRRSRFNGVHAA